MDSYEAYELMCNSTNFIRTEDENKNGETLVIETDRIKIEIGSNWCEYFIDDYQYTFLNTVRPTYDFMKYFLPKVGRCAKGNINGNPPGDSAEVKQEDFDKINQEIDDFRAKREKTEIASCPCLTSSTEHE